MASTQVFTASVSVSDGEDSALDSVDITVTPVSATSVVTLFEDDFETDLGWTVNPDGSDTATAGTWQRADPQLPPGGYGYQLDSTTSGTMDLVTGPLAGASVGDHDLDNGQTSIRSPDIDIPADATNVSLTLNAYLAHHSNTDAADYLRVRVIGESSSSTMLNLTGSPTIVQAAWAGHQSDISAFAGQRIHLLVEANDSAPGSLVEAAVDDVRIVATVPGAPLP